MPVVDGDVVQGAISFTMVNGDEGRNIFTFLINKVSIGDWSDVQIGTFVTDAIEAVLTEGLLLMDAAMTFDTVDIYKRVGVLWDYLATTAPSLTPDGSGHVLPGGVATLVTAYTALNRVFGRKFLYGVTTTHLQEGLLNAAGLALLAAVADQFLTSYTGGTMGPLDFLVPGVWSTKTAAFEPFNGVAVVKNVLSYQRRRKSGVGV